MMQLIYPFIIFVSVYAQNLYRFDFALKVHIDILEVLLIVIFPFFLKKSVKISRKDDLLICSDIDLIVKSTKKISLNDKPFFVSTFSLLF